MLGILHRVDIVLVDDVNILVELILFTVLHLTEHYILHQTVRYDIWQYDDDNEVVMRDDDDEM